MVWTGFDKVQEGDNPLSFSLDIERWAAKTEARMDLTVRYLSLELLRRLVLRSPVDTGRFRANWQVDIGQAPEGTLETTDKGGASTVSRGDTKLAAVQAGQSVFLVNNLPYAQVLEDGSSSQAPQGMVAITVQEFNEALSRGTSRARSERL